METMRNIEFIEKSSLFHSYKKILYFRDFDLKSDVKIFFYIHFCRARRALSNHIKYFRKKNFTPLLNYAHLTSISCFNEISLTFHSRDHRVTK